MKVKRIYDGKVFWRIEKAPFYTTGVYEQMKAKGYKINVCLRYWQLPFGVYLAKRQYVKDVSRELKDAIYRAAERKWGYVKVCFELSRYTIIVISTKTGEPIQRQTFYDETYKFFKIGEMTFTDHPQVLYCEDTKKYYGYSHRASMGFGIGDMLFTEEPLSDDVLMKVFCADKKLRRDYIKVLKRYHRHNDYFSFFDTIKCGIGEVIPFRKKGTKKIETSEEAFQAALNFARYVS